MRVMLEKILGCYGKEAELRGREQTQTVRAFLQPVTGRGERGRIGNSPLGQQENGEFVYIGPVSPQAEAGDTLVCGGEMFLFRRCETVDGISGPAYRWGICVRKGAEDTWGMNG